MLKDDFILSNVCNQHLSQASPHPATYMFKVNNRNTRTRCEICQWRRSSAFIVNFEHISIVTFEQVNADWDHSIATLSNIDSTTDVIMKNKIKLILRKEKFRGLRAKISKYPSLTWN